MTIPHLMWMVIYAHLLCTYILLNVCVSCIRNFLHKEVDIFSRLGSQPSHKPQQAAQTERQTKTTAAVSAGPAKSQECPGLNLSTMRPMASRARRCPARHWQAGPPPTQT